MSSDNGKVRKKNNNIVIVGYHPKYADDFAALNYQWITEFFVIEPEDRAALDHPEAYAIDNGGEIFFLLDRSSGGETVIGTAALVPKKVPKKALKKTWKEAPQQAVAQTAEAIEVYELAKMAVSPNRQGEGLGQLLLQHCIEFARQRRGKQIILTTNDILKPALAVYHKLGFRDLPVNPDERYERGNLAMVLDLAEQN
jgi:GNAT superfamily N-acetyltransferase|tara:strand:- start:164 stop:757 length:594 start_codon:yes stop_codon:yes gene_type:complete